MLNIYEKVVDLYLARLRPDPLLLDTLDLVKFDENVLILEIEADEQVLILQIEANLLPPGISS